MRTRIFIISLASASLLSFSAFAHSPGTNHGTISQTGSHDTAGIGQVAGPNSSNTASISQSGSHDMGVTGQAAMFGGKNTSTTTQSGSHDTAVTSQTAF